jgi:hypothetical protein
MPGDHSGVEIDFYKQQLADARLKLRDDPGNSENQDLVRDLESTIEKLEREAPNSNSVVEESPAVSIVGRTCEAFFDGKWYNAEILIIRTDQSGLSRVIVKLMGTEQAREYDLKDIRLLQQRSHRDFPLGRRVQSIWTEDGLWYNGTIAGVGKEGGFQVTYDGFEGEPVEVKTDMVREPVIVPEEAKAKEVKTYTTPGGYVLPEKLKIDKKRDSEAVIEEKKRKAHHLKSQQRSERHEAEANASKQMWKQFQQKVPRR